MIIVFIIADLKFRPLKTFSHFLLMTKMTHMGFKSVIDDFWRSGVRYELDYVLKDSKKIFIDQNKNKTL